jgi:3-deoxy-manno-octulosonate cytidylyltransferase (CMP-KDO synthetase)
VELHGKHPQQIVITIIPARYASLRLPGKLLLGIAGKPLILHTIGQAAKARSVSRVIVATDDKRIFDVVRQSGAEVAMTSMEHESGSDRVAEVAEGLPANSIIVNVQGDEPMISPATIDLAVEALLADSSADMSTTSEAVASFEQLIDGNVVKVVTNDAGYAVYFSRSPVPYPRETIRRYPSPEKALFKEPGILSLFRKHTGLYVYRREYLLALAKMPQTRLEKIEMLEQLRAVENGAKIKVVEVSEASRGVDTPEDFEEVKRLIEENG